MKKDKSGQVYGHSVLGDAGWSANNTGFAPFIQYQGIIDHAMASESITTANIFLYCPEYIVKDTQYDRNNARDRVAEYHRYGKYICVKILEGWGEKCGRTCSYVLG